MIAAWMIAAWMFAAAFAFGQVDYSTATLQGLVLDPQENSVPGAKVTVINEATGVTKVAVTTAQGYQIPALLPGKYRVEVEAAGFSKSVARDVILTVGELAAYDVHLKLGTQSTIVEVEADIPLVQPEQSQQANIINTTQVENLPNITRNFVQSIYTLPGVVNSFAPALQDPGVGTGYQSSGFSTGGSNGRNNLVTIDGGENDYGSGALRVTHVPIDSIQEFQVNRNAFEAEFGFTVGTAINMVTRSGTNRYHGSVAGYFRDRATDAENYFNGLAGLGGKPFEQSAIFSGTLGGPIKQNKLFFFTAPEYQRLDAATVQNIAGEQEFQGIASQPNGYSGGSCPNQRTPQQQVTQLCYLTQMANSGGPLSALGAGLLQSSIFGNPLSNPILKGLVAPNDGTFDGILSGPSGSGVRAIPGFNTPRGRYFNWVSRLDYLPGIRDTLTLRFSLMHELDNVSPAPPYSGSAPQRDYTITGTWTKVMNSNLVNTVRAQVVPSNTFDTYAPSPNGAEIDLGNQIQLGSPFGYPYSARWKRFQFDDGLTWVKGSHTLKFGGSWRPDDYTVTQKVWFGGEWEFTDGAFSIENIVAVAQGTDAAAALASYNLSQGYPAGGPPSTNLSAVQSYLAGAPTLLLQANPQSNATWSGWIQALGLYAQDSWKVTPRLTVNYGARFDYSHNPAPVPSNGRVTPRLGIAWEPSADHKTVIRAGAGIFDAPPLFLIPFYANLLGPSGKYVNQNALVAGLPSPPFPSIFAAWALEQSHATAAFPNPALTNADLASLGITIGPPGPAAFGNFIYTMTPNFTPEYSVQASFSIAREFAHNFSVELGYLMYRSVHVEQVLETNFVRNTAAPIDPFVGPQYVAKAGSTAGEPNSSIFQNNGFFSGGNGIYNGGTISLTRRLAAGLQFQANYTLSRAIDDTSDFSSLSTLFRPDLLNLDRSVSDFNITHNFVANAVYTTPFRAGRGNFLEKALADVNISPIFYARSGVPFTLLVPGMANGTIGHNANARPWYEGRNDGIGPAYYSFDLRISKTLINHERPRLDLIAQGQNLLNRTNFAAVNSNFPVDPNYALPGGGTLQNGPFNVRGFQPSSVSQLSDPLSFTSAFRRGRSASRYGWLFERIEHGSRFQQFGSRLEPFLEPVVQRLNQGAFRDFAAAALEFRERDGGAQFEHPGFLLLGDLNRAPETCFGGESFAVRDLNFGKQSVQFGHKHLLLELARMAQAFGDGVARFLVAAVEPEELGAHQTELRRIDAGTGGVKGVEPGAHLRESFLQIARDAASPTEVNLREGGPDEIPALDRRIVALFGDARDRSGIPASVMNHERVAKPEGGRRVIVECFDDGPGKLPRALGLLGIAHEPEAHRKKARASEGRRHVIEADELAFALRIVERKAFFSLRASLDEIAGVVDGISVCVAAHDLNDGIAGRERQVESPLALRAGFRDFAAHHVEGLKSQSGLKHSRCVAQLLGQFEGFGAGGFDLARSPAECRHHGPGERKLGSQLRLQAFAILGGIGVKERQRSLVIRETFAQARTGLRLETRLHPSVRGLFDAPGAFVVTREHFGIRFREIREPLDQRFGDLAVKLLASFLEQRFVRGILNQRVLKRVTGIRRHTGFRNQIEIDQVS
jgi:hypothetical protein